MTFGPLGLETNGVPRASAIAAPRRRRWLVISTRQVPLSSLATVEIPVLGLIGLIVSLSIIVAPDSSLRGTDVGLPEIFICPFFALMHIPCLLCGLTRSFMAMGGLDIRQAFIFHPLGPVFYIATLMLGSLMAWSLARRRRVSLRVSEVVRKNLIRYASAVLLTAWLLKVVIWRQTGLL